MILQVHDELNFSVPEAEKEIIQKIVIEEMERAYRMLVPLKAVFYSLTAPKRKHTILVAFDNLIKY